MSVFFRKLRINESTGTATIIATDKPISSTKKKIGNMDVAVRSTGSVTFGILSLIDPKTEKVMRANHPTIKQLQQELNQGDEMPGFQLSDNPVVDLNSGEETNLRWIEASN
tara:strand:- start:120 stop:452 length:333 start_codon:yes stop_codon:yes gene_type:complete